MIGEPARNIGSIYCPDIGGGRSFVGMLEVVEMKFPGNDERWVEHGQSSANTEFAGLHVS